MLPPSFRPARASSCVLRRRTFSLNSSKTLKRNILSDIYGATAWVFIRAHGGSWRRSWHARLGVIEINFYTNKILNNTGSCPPIGHVCDGEKILKLTLQVILRNVSIFSLYQDYVKKIITLIHFVLLSEISKYLSNKSRRNN